MLYNGRNYAFKGMESESFKTRSEKQMATLKSRIDHYLTQEEEGKDLLAFSQKHEAWLDASGLRRIIYTSNDVDAIINRLVTLAMNDARKVFIDDFYADYPEVVNPNIVIDASLVEHIKYEIAMSKWEKEYLKDCRSTISDILYGKLRDYLKKEYNI